MSHYLFKSFRIRTFIKADQMLLPGTLIPLCCVLGLGYYLSCAAGGFIEEGDDLCNS